MTVPSALAVFAHPDDESLSAGGLLARSASEGGRTAVVTTTWAEDSPRAKELAESLRILGADSPRFLGYADTRLPESARNRPRFRVRTVPRCWFRISHRLPVPHCWEASNRFWPRCTNQSAPDQKQLVGAGGEVETWPPGVAGIVCRGGCGPAVRNDSQPLAPQRTMCMPWPWLARYSTTAGAPLVSRRTTSSAAVESQLS